MKNKADGSRKPQKHKTELDLNEPMRLNKILAESGVASRRKADELIASGAVKINGRTVTELGTKATRSDFITVNGDPVKEVQRLIYILLNKPKDYITTTNDEKNRKTVLDIVKKRERIFPVGRLDRKTTGVILLTNDGELAHRLMHPRYEVQRMYNATLDKELLPEDAKQLAAGIDLEDGWTAPCEVFIHPDDRKFVTVTLTEGKNHEVRRMFDYFGYDVLKLDRKMYAGLTTSGLARGEYRHLTRQEVLRLHKMTGLA